MCVCSRKKKVQSAIPLNYTFRTVLMSYLSILGWFLHSAAVPPELLHLCRSFYFRYLCSTGERSDDDVYGDYDGISDWR